MEESFVHENEALEVLGDAAKAIEPPPQTPPDSRVVSIFPRQVVPAAARDQDVKDRIEAAPSTQFAQDINT
jgi:hypothetical protein